MAAETIVIDIIANFKNQTTSGMNTAKQSTDRFTDSLKKAKKEADRLGGTNANPKVNLVDRASSKLSEIDRGLKAVAGKTVRAGVKIIDYATKPLRAIKNALFSIKGLVAAVGIGMAANKFLAQPIGLADAYSSAKIGFSNLLGEAGGQKMMDDLDDFAKATPFKTSGVIANAQKMMAMGWNTDTLLKDMETIGDAAAATGKMDQGLESIVRALAQIKTKGKLSTEELNQLSEAGIAAKAMLAEQLGYGTGDSGIAKMTKDLEKGLIGSDVAIQALLAGMEQFDGTMKKTANETVEGLKSQLEDTFEINILRKWGQGLQDGAKRGLGSILELLDSSEEKLAAFGDSLYEIGKELSNWAADKLENTIDKILEVSESEEFKNASFGGKIKIMWDEVIAKPFGEWWDSKGRPYMAEKMGNLGEGLGSGLTKGLLTLLGVDVSGMYEDATSVGGSFAKGFAKGFEASKVGDAIIDALARAFKAGVSKLFTGSGLEKAIVAYLGFKGIMGAVNGVSALQTLWGGTGATMAGGGGMTLAGMGLKGILGSTGNAVVNGSGILGKLASLGYFMNPQGMMMGNLAGTTAAGMSGTAAAFTGLGTVAGGAMTAYGLFDTGRDFYTAYKTDGSTELGHQKKMAYTNSGALKGSGLAAGAAAGAAIGSVIPVIGTALGALLGAGAGYLGGKFLGDREVKRYEELAKETEAAKYNSQEMKDAIMEGTASADELQAIFNKACTQDMVDRFGSVELSMEEIEKYAKKIVFGKQAEVMDKFASASQKASQSLQTFKTAANDMERLNFDMSEREWKIEAGIDVKMNEAEISEVKARVQAFMDSAEQTLSDNHYEFNVAVDVLIDDKETRTQIKVTGNDLYNKLQNELNAANKSLEAQYEIALKDGKITAKEQEIISQYQKKVTEIIEKVSNAETEASFEIAKMKFTSGDLSAESFTNFQSELNTQLKDYTVQQEEALNVAVSDIKLQMKEDPENTEKYEKQIQDLMNGYNANIKEMKANVEKVQLQGISEAFDGAGTVEQLQGAINALTEEGKNPVNLTFSDINAHLNLGEDALSEEEKANFTSVMKSALESSMTAENALKPAADVDTTLNINQEKLTEATSSVYNGVSAAVQNPFTEKPIAASAKVGVDLSYYVNSGGTATVDINGKSTTLTAIVTGGKKADGGLVDKATQVIIGEAGPEMIIPLSSNRRQRGRSLWERAGRAMGLLGSGIPNADGGVYGVGSSRLNDMISGAFSANNTDNTPKNNGKTEVKVNVGGITIQVASADEIGDVDTMAGKIAKALEKAWQNIPVTTGA